jgi:phosphatidate cytidylyltransferase
VLRARLATAAVAIPLLLALFLYGPLWGFTAFVCAIAMLGIAEHATMAFPDDRRERFATLAAGAMLVAAVTSGNAEWVSVTMLVVVFAAFMWVLLVVPDFRDGYRALGMMLPGVLYVGLFLPHFALLHQIPEIGRYLTVFVVAVGMAGDTAGYFVGREFGRHKLIPAVSPGKTIEGSIGIFAGSIAGALLCRWWFLPGMGWMEAVGLGTVMSVLGQVGDLSESVIKRTFGTKESGWIFPGHGGVLDRIDSLVFPVAFLYYYQTWFQ